MPKLQSSYIFKIIFILCTLLTIKTSFAGEVFDEKLIFDFDGREWVAESAEINKIDNNYRVKYKLKDETLDDSSENVTTIFYPLESERNEIAYIKYLYKDFMNKICPNYYWNDIEETEDYILSTLHLDGCTIIDNNIYAIIAFVRSELGVHLIRYSARDMEVFNIHKDKWEFSFGNLSTFTPNRSNKNLNKDYLSKFNSMIKIQYHLDSPEVSENKFMFTPRTLWRSSTKYFRNEKQEDRRNEIKELFVVNEPDVWIVNLLDSSGEHIVDPGPTYKTVCPIFENEPVSGKTYLEHGQEKAYFDFYGARQLSDTTINSENCQVYELTVDEYVLHLYIDEYTEIPRLITRRGQNKRLILLWYDLYETDLFFDISLFTKPDGISWQ